MGVPAALSQSEIDAATAAELAELKGLAASVISRSPEAGADLEPALLRMDQDIARAAHPVEAERAAERFARELRHVWLRAAASAASTVYRSPTHEQTPVTAAGKMIEFGYERDLHPHALERRCHSFFQPPPKPWRVEHAVFSSGQAAMSAGLLSAAATPIMMPAPRPLTVVHLGSYFETRQLLALMPHEFQVQGPEQPDADVFVIEPVSCDGCFHRVDVASLIGRLRALARKPRLFIFDCTLVGRGDGLPGYLRGLSDVRPCAVIRVNSGLKLWQAGLELADVGVLSTFEHEQSESWDLSQSMSRIRTLMGTGLRFAEVAALEAPWFLDPAYTGRLRSRDFCKQRATGGGPRQRQPPLRAGVPPGAVFSRWRRSLLRRAAEGP